MPERRYEKRALLEAGFTESQANHLASLDRRKPWLRPFATLAVLVLFFVGIAIWQVNDLVDSIQSNRLEVSRENCESQNQNHDATINKLDELLEAAVEQDPGHEERIRASQDFTVQLIDQLAPKRDCDSVVEKLRVDG